jgi:hypothetical protein
MPVMDDGDPMFTVQQFPPEAVRALNEDTSRAFVIWSMLRKELSPFAPKVEHTYYPPGTTENDKLDLMVFNWCGQPWYILAVPLQDVSIAERTAEGLGLRLTVAGCVPTLMEDGRGQRILGNLQAHKVRRLVAAGWSQLDRFPLDTPRVRSLEVEHGPDATDAAGNRAPVPVAIMSEAPANHPTIKPGMVFELTPEQSQRAIDALLNRKRKRRQ